MAEEIKYINADEFYIKLNTTRSPDSKFGGDDYTDGFDAGIWAAMEKLKTMPKEDVVKIVRCKDCKYAHCWYGNDTLGNTKYLCHYIEYDKYYPDVFADDFCSRGERKELDNG